MFSFFSTDAMVFDAYVLQGFRYQWPRNEKEVLALTASQYHRLLEGLAIEPRRFPLPKDMV